MRGEKGRCSGGAVEHDISTTQNFAVNSVGGDILH